ncbi:MAG: hypothetical protein J0M12_05495 [Deltaproteobacteria bacterium]|nr:hypothetical protein [Deltaproteobacteria bacterium]
MKYTAHFLGLASLLMVGLHATTAFAQTIHYIEANEDGSGVVEATCPILVSAGSNGTSTYQLSRACGPLQSLALTRNPNVDSTKKALLSGILKISNTNSVKKLYSLVIEIPFPEVDITGLKVGGLVQRFFKTDANGGTINAIMSTTGMVHFFVDAAGVNKMWAFPPPTQATITGSGQQTTNYLFGQNVSQQTSDPIYPAEDINTSIGLSLAFGLTGGDYVEFTPVVYATGIPAVIDCASDLDGDQMVTSADLGILMGAWGMPGATDLNSDGTTNSMDMSILLGAWGACG